MKLEAAAVLSNLSLGGPGSGQYEHMKKKLDAYHSALVGLGFKPQSDVGMRGLEYEHPSGVKVALNESSTGGGRSRTKYGATVPKGTYEWKSFVTGQSRPVGQGSASIPRKSDNSFDTAKHAYNLQLLKDHLSNMHGIR